MFSPTSSVICTFILILPRFCFKIRTAHNEVHPGSELPIPLKHLDQNLVLQIWRNQDSSRDNSPWLKLGLRQLASSSVTTRPIMYDSSPQVFSTDLRQLTPRFISSTKQLNPEESYRQMILLIVSGKFSHIKKTN